jgi:biopolymer transport protein ExbB
MLSTIGIINIWLLISCILALLISIKIFLLLKNSNYNKQKFINEIDATMRKTDVENILSITKSYPQNHIAWAIEVALDGLNSFKYNKTTLETIELVNNSIQRCRNLSKLKFNSGLYFLLSIGITSPMIGLFGSIVSIYESFHLICCITDSPPEVHLCYHLSFAPYETMYGLIVGIPALWLYFYFVHKNKVLFME